MIDTAVQLLRDELVQYLTVIGYNHPENFVVIENIALLESNATTNLDNSIVFTVVNIEEESTLKNIPAFSKNLVGKARYENPPIYLNVYLLISCSSKSITGDMEYIDTLTRLSHVIRFFQGKNSFVQYDPTKIGPFDDIMDFKIKAELYTMTFEQINHLWGVLGGKQMPSVLYKLRLVALTSRRLLREVPLIEEIDANLHP